MMNCIAVDDEKLILDLLVDYIHQVPFLHLIARCKNALEAAEVISREKIDLAFLDIQMPGINGLRFIETLPTPPIVVFVTAYKEFALESFSVNALDYLLKPVSFERFLKACNKAQEQFSLHLLRLAPGERPYFFVYVEYNQVRVNIPDIVYVEGMKDYVKIFMRGQSKPIITKMSMKAMEEKLHDYRFMRIHKSFIVSADKVTAIKRDLVCLDKTELPLSDNYKSSVEKLLSR